MYSLRDYQKPVSDITIRFLQKNPGLHGLVVMPTGSGKSIVIADFIKEIVTRWKIPTLLLSHSKEILKQDAEKLHLLLPDYDIQYYSASLKSKKKGKHITIGSVQTVVNNIDLFEDTRLIIVDEAQMIPPNQEGSYNAIFKQLPKARIIGYTATPFRYKGKLTDPGHIFHKIIYEVRIRTLINKGYLSPIFAKETKYEIDTSKLKIVAGDYSKKSMSDEIDRFGITKAICDNMLQFKETRKHWLIFCVSINHAKHIAEYLTSLGIMTMAVHSKMESWERDLVIKLYTEGKLHAVAQVNILSVGFDFPDIDLISLMRPTRSQVFHRQSAGRGLRIAPGKKDCMILDYAGNFKRLGPIDEDPVFDKLGRPTGGRAPTKTCPECDEIVPLSVRICPDCGYKFPEIEKLFKGAKAGAVLSDQKESLKRTYKIYGAFYSKTQKPGKKPVMKVTYKLRGFKRISEWLGFEAEYISIRKKAHNWWKRRSKESIPKTTNEALEKQSSLILPNAIEVDESEKYPKITGYIFKSDVRIE